ncbi:MAG: hypothetical protein JO320_18570 [Alphaproteobacteria bacterium]|nr:hypothetical protein [Alphaproteobacteria bacterium]
MRSLLLWRNSTTGADRIRDGCNGARQLSPLHQSRPGSAKDVDIARGNPVKMLFGEGYALQSVLLSLIFCSLLNLSLFAYWLPEVLCT